LDITNAAKQHWNSVSHTHQTQITSKYEKHLQFAYAVNDLYIPAVVSLDEIADLADNIHTMFH